MKTRAQQFLCWLGLALLCSSCLLQRVLVSKLDTLVEYRVSSTLQLYVKQDRLLEKDIPAYLNAQRVIAPRMKSIVQSIDLKRPEEGKRLIAELLELYRDLESDFRKLLIKYMLDLDANQRKAFYGKIKEQNEEFAEKLKTDRTELYHDRIEFFIGDLTDEQTKLFKPYELVFLEKDRERLVRREAFLVDLRTILEDPSPERSQKLTERFLRQQRESFSSTKHIEAFLDVLVKSLNKEQVTQLETKRAEILEMIDQFAKTTYE